MAKTKSYCIVCGKERQGIEVEDDYVLDSIRWFKKNVTKNERGNRLVVCSGCYLNYKKSRAKYESRQRLYLGLGVLFVIMSLVASFQATTLIVSLLVLLLLYFFSLLSYMPRISIKKQANQ